MKTTELNRRIEELKKEYQEDEKKLNQLEQARQQMIQLMLIKRGRILELEQWQDNTQSKASSEE
jgi:predicted RNase H-like nuclease (RuvC/YqgF family)